MKKAAPTILVIEDEPTQRAWMERILTSAGYPVSLARDGREALQLIDSKESYSLLVVDLLMPVVSGFEVLDKLWSRGIEIPTLIASGIIVPEIHHYLKTHSETLLLSKPLSQETLLQAVDQLIGASPGRQGSGSKGTA